jgi:predicted TIM-barrel fold metal-dependent hydrolase
MAIEPKVTRRIDVHAHYLPPGYRETAMAALKDVPDGMPRMPDWQPETTVAMMDRQEIATAMLSVSSPGVHFGNDEAARRMARSVNEYAARTVQDHRGRFGTFASLPLPDIDAALEEVRYALEVLKVNGFVMLTNYGGVYLGDVKFNQVFDELNRRSAIIFVHPTSPPCWEHIALGFPRPMIEFPFDTTRAVTNLVISGTLERCPNLRIIVPHAGGTLPFLARRIEGMVSRLSLTREPRPSGSFLAQLQRLFYDTAGSSGDNSIASLLTLVDSSHMLYGSDYPFTPEAVIETMIKELNSTRLLTAQDRQAMEHGNAMKLFSWS